MHRIPFHRATTAPTTLQSVAQALKGPIAGGGPLSKRAEAELAGLCGAVAALLTPSCTDALEMAALLAGIQPGDEVILPSFTFSSTANAFVLRGAIPVFCDVRDDTCNLDERLVEALLTPATKAIVAVHYAGVACEMDILRDISASRGLHLVEDAAQGLFGSYKGKPLGSFGETAALSFHETKNLTTGEGGALLINDAELLERARIIQEKGTNRHAFFLGMIDKYTWVDVGSSFLVSEITAALLVAQLQDAERIQRRRHELWERYRSQLADWSSSTGVKLPFIPAEVEHPAHLFAIRFPSPDFRERARHTLLDRDIDAVTHYVPLHSSPYGRRVGRGECPVSEAISDTLLRLPLYTDLLDDEQDEIIDTLTGVTA